MRQYITDPRAYGNLPIARLKPCEWRGLQKAIEKMEARRDRGRS